MLAVLLVHIVVATAPISVVDGDTLRSGGETYRIENIDAPETGPRAECPSEVRLGRAATRRARALTAAADQVTLEVLDRRDRYDRAIARVRLDGRDLGDQLIAEGLAQPWRGRKARWCG